MFFFIIYLFLKLLISSYFNIYGRLQ